MRRYSSQASCGLWLLMCTRHNHDCMAYSLRYFSERIIMKCSSASFQLPAAEFAVAMFQLKSSSVWK